MTTLELSFDSVVEQVKRWPPDYRLALAQEILRSLTATYGSSAPRSKTLARALGLLTSEQPVPSDATIKQWLRERREEKYGR